MTSGVETLPSIAPLPDAAIDLPPAIAAVEVTPALGSYPHRAVAGQVFEVNARAITPEGTPAMNGVLRWRKALSPLWREEPLQSDGNNEFTARWSPAEPGDYEWCVELWIGNDARQRPGSSGADVLRLLRVDRPDIATGNWRSAPRVPLEDIGALIDPTTDILLLPAIFPQDADGLTGLGGAGHYSIDPALGDTRSFGELATAAGAAGVSLALTVPLECSPQHPMRDRHAAAFTEAAVPDFTGAGWRELWLGWEAVFRFWLVQGIDIFHIPRPSVAPVSFWQSLLERLRDDFPPRPSPPPAATLTDQGEHLLGAGLTPAPAATETAPGSLPERAAPAAAAQTFDETLLTPLPLAVDGDEDAPALDMPPGLLDELDVTEEPETCDTSSIACSCSNDALAVSIGTESGGGYVLRVENSDPTAAQSGHVHIDSAALGMSEHDLYYMRDLANGRAFRWSGTTNFLSLAPGETAKTFRLERN